MHQVGKSEYKNHYKSYKVNIYINLFWTTKNKLNNRGFFLHLDVILHIFDVQANFNFTVTVCEHLLFTIGKYLTSISSERAEHSASKMAAKFKYKHFFFCFVSKFKILKKRVDKSAKLHYRNVTGSFSRLSD